MRDSPRIEELKRRVQVDPASIAFAALAEEYRRAGRFEEAIATCQAGLQRHPAYLSAHVTLGRALLELGRFDEARDELEHVLRAAPENLAAIRGLAEIHHRRGELPEALEQYRTALHVARHDTEIADAVDQISRQVSPPAPADPVAVPPVEIATPEPPAAAPMTPSTVAAPSVPAAIPLARAPQIEPVPAAGPTDAPAAVEGPVTPAPVAPLKVSVEPDRPAKPSSRPHLELVTRPQRPPAHEQTLSALEDLLASILREKAALSGISDAGR